AAGGQGGAAHGAPRGRGEPRAHHGSFAVVPRVAYRGPRDGQDVVLPELDHDRRRRTVAGDTQLHGRGADEPRGSARLFDHDSRVSGPGRDRRRRVRRGGAGGLAVVAQAQEAAKRKAERGGRRRRVPCGRVSDQRLDAIFKAYDIRGLYPDDLDDDVARRIGNAFVAFTGTALVLVGRDMRPSSEPLAAAFADGATLAGADVIELGLISTDLVYFASGRLDAPAAMFTASHNPAQYNGIKLCRAGAAPVGQDTGLTEIKATVASGLLERAAERGRVEQRDLLPEYVEHVHSFV